MSFNDYLLGEGARTRSTPSSYPFSLFSKSKFSTKQTSKIQIYMIRNTTHKAHIFMSFIISAKFKNKLPKSYLNLYFKINLKASFDQPLHFVFNMSQHQNNFS